MAFIPVPNVAEVNLGYTADLGWTWSNGLHFYNPSGWTTSTLGLIAITAADAWDEVMTGIFAANCNLTKVSARDLSSALGAYYDYTLPTPVAGVRSGQAMALQVAMTVTQRTALRGRSYRGRIFHYGLANEDKQNEKSWQSAVAAEVQSAYSAMIAAIEIDGDCTNVVISRYAGKSSRITGVSTPVTAIQGRLKIATQRRRLNQ